MDHYFIINGTSEDGNYNVYEVVYGNRTLVHQIYGGKRGGLKAGRQFIGQYLKDKGFSLDSIVPHQCVKPGREDSKNPWHLNTTVQDYLDGIDPNKKKIELNLTISPGDVIDNNELVDIFKCSGQSGMRPANKTNTLVLVSKQVGSLYENKWDGNIIHYTGMGKRGDQSLTRQNKILYRSRENGVEVHLFEVLKDKEYTYKGRVELVSAPYQEYQLDEDKLQRKVWMFPLSLLEENSAVNKKDLEEANKNKVNKAQSMTMEELLNRAKLGSGKTGRRNATITHYQRDPFVAEYAKRRAKGTCQLCEQPAPFKSKNGEPYLESHHIEWLARGGEDTIENTVALCPNCHKKMHVIDDYQDIVKLKGKV